MNLFFYSQIYVIDSADRKRFEETGQVILYSYIRPERYKISGKICFTVHLKHNIMLIIKLC